MCTISSGFTALFRVQHSEYRKLNSSCSASEFARVSQEGAFALDTHEVLILEFFEVVGKGRIRDVQFLLNIADHKPVGMRGKQQLHDSQARLGPHGGQHVRILGDLIRDSLVRGPPYFDNCRNIGYCQIGSRSAPIVVHETLSGGPGSGRLRKPSLLS